MNRRDFLRATGMAAAGGALADSRRPALAEAGQPDPGGSPGQRPVPGPQPNILFILVDELRFPSVFPAGVNSVDEFLLPFMPNVYSLWQRGVKFGSHYTAATACSP